MPAAQTDTTANPAPLGLLGFGMTTILLNLHNVGAFPISTMILAMGLFYGGLAQIVAGLMEWKKGNTFGTTAFLSYGFFWLSLVATLVWPAFGVSEAPNAQALGAYLAVWGVLTFFLFINTFRINRILQFVFGTLTALFFLLAAGNLMEDQMVLYYGGVVGILCGGLAMYAAIAQVTNEMYGKIVFPLGHIKR